MKILFLDIDGVLNSLATKPDDPRWLGDWLDPKNVTQLARAIEETGASIVLTSSWRLSTSRSEVQRALAEKGCDAELAGVTPDLGPQKRHLEIRHWLETAQRVPEEWLAIDDETLEGLEERQIRTSRLHGLTKSETDEIIRRLGARN